jgi:hypothetical protein
MYTHVTKLLPILNVVSIMACYSIARMGKDSNDRREFKTLLSLYSGVTNECSDTAGVCRTFGVFRKVAYKFRLYDHRKFVE